MKTPLIVSGLAVAAGLASSANAGFTGFTVTNVGTIGGRDVYQVYANFSVATDIILNCLKHNVTAGSMSGVQHNDFGGTAPAGTWNPSLTILPDQLANDSYVTVTGQAGAAAGTNLDPSFGAGTGAAIPNGAGWLTANPGSPILFSGGRIKIMQVAGSSFSQSAVGYTARLTIGYKANANSTTPLYAENLTYTIGLVPAPGALALLGIAGLAGRRRRA